MIYTFKLYRRLPIVRTLPRSEDDTGKKYTSGTIISAFNIDRECEDPFRERIKLGHEYPGWGVGNEFKSDTDIEFDSTFDAEELDVTHKTHDGNKLKGPTVTDASFDNLNEDDDYVSEPDQ